jgi:protein-S-isoprenylcysteine O-methyltransferase Ste14
MTVVRRADRRPGSWRWGNVPLPEPYLLGIAIGAGLHRLRPWPLPGSPIAHRLAGWPLAGMGALLVGWSSGAAGRVDLGQPGHLVTWGPYALTRNPMYLGWGLLHLGVGLAAGTGWVVATVPLAAGWVHREVLREERALGAAFGDEAASYRAAVPRYLPGRPR